MKEVRKIIFVNVKTNLKIFFPKEIFDDILEDNEEYGFKMSKLK